MSVLEFNEWGTQRPKLACDLCVEDTGNKTLNFSVEQRELVFINDYMGDCTIKITSIDDTEFEITIKKREIIDERFKEFKIVQITSLGDWRLYTRSGRVE